MNSQFFDEASKVWRANKKKKGEAFVYLCQHVKKNGKLCNNTSFTHNLNFDLFCKWHFLDSQKKA